MIVVRYSDQFSPKELNEYYHWLKGETKEEIIFLPQDWDILFDCSTAELYNFIDHIKEIIRQKGVVNED